MSSGFGVRYGFKAVLMAVLAILMFLTITNLMLRTSGMKQIEPRVVKFDQTLEEDYHSLYGLLGHEFESALAERDLTASTRRNLFAQYRSTEDFFVLVDIRLEPLALIYKGHIEQRDGSFIAQVNWGDRTYFVRQGETIDVWRMSEVTPEKLVIKHTDGETITLPYRETTYRKERNAIIYNYLKQEEVTVRVGGTLEDFTVAEIGENSVRLTGKEEITLTK